MHTTAAWFLTVVAATAPAPDVVVPVPSLDPGGAIVVDCAAANALERALARVAKHRPVEIRLEGVCRGAYRVESGNVTLRANSPGSGLEAGAANGDAPVLEVAGAQVTLRGTVVRGGALGVHAHGADSEVLLVEIDLSGQSGIALYVENGASVRVLNGTIRDGGDAGVVLQTNVRGFFIDSAVRGFDAGMVVSDRSFAGISGTTIEDNRIGGLNVTSRSDVNVLGGAFRNNAQVHVNANDWSSVALLFGVELGSPGDPTEYAFGSARNSRVSCNSTPNVYGHVSALDRGSVRLYDTVVSGDVVSWVFADVALRNVTVGGIVACVDAGAAVCNQTSSAGALGCPSPACGPALPAEASFSAAPEPFRIDDRPALPRPRR